MRKRGSTRPVELLELVAGHRSVLIERRLQPLAEPGTPLRGEFYGGLSACTRSVDRCCLHVAPRFLAWTRTSRLRESLHEFIERDAVRNRAVEKLGVGRRGYSGANGLSMGAARISSCVASSRPGSCFRRKGTAEHAHVGFVS